MRIIFNWIILQAKINIAMAYKAPEGAGGGGGKGGSQDVADEDEDEGESAPLGSGDTEDAGNLGEGERLSGEAGKTSAATEEASVANVY